MIKIENTIVHTNHYFYLQFKRKMQRATFIAPNTFIDIDFWSKLYDQKLNTFKLDNSERVIYLDNSHFTANSFSDDANCNKCFLINTNTIEEFMSIDKKSLLESKREYLLNLFQSSSDIHNLNTKILLSFVDLKKYTFVHMVGTPTFVPINPYEFMIIEHDNTYEEINLNNKWAKRFENNTYILTNYEVLDLSFGWDLRNFLAFLSITCDSSEKTFCNIMCKTKGGTKMLFKFCIPKYSHEDFRLIGWEKHKVCDLSSILDLSKIVSQANDLNLKLMKWKMWETLDTDKISNTRCLLLGAGTLGCSIARLLIGWGFTNLTFVDNGVVSYSNPNRQSLYDVDDCVDRKFKAIASVEKLLKINPSLTNCVGHVGTIPCPDHIVLDEQKSFDDFTMLENLIATSDVVFTLTDDRESRWLPVVLTSMHHNKILINVALGFETYLVSRIDTNNKENGCYFCGDIHAVYNSQINKSADQRCTITRPGISAIASGLAVEMLINFMHNKNMEVEQIRGNVTDYEIHCAKTYKSDYCVACSDKIKEEYLKHGYDFVKNACNSFKYLEEISGINELTRNLCLESIDYDEDI